MRSQKTTAKLGLNFLLIASVIFGTLIPIYSATANDSNIGIIAKFENFYAPVDKTDCSNGTARVTKLDGSPFVEFDNFTLTVNNSKGSVLGSSIYETFASEDGSTELFLPVQICGADQNYLGPNESYSLQVKFLSSDRKFAQEFVLSFLLIPVDAKAKAAKAVRDACPQNVSSRSPYFINWTVESASKVKPGGTLRIVGTLYRNGYAADNEKIIVVKHTSSPSAEKIIGTFMTDLAGKFVLSWKFETLNYPLYYLNIGERNRPVGPYYGVFQSLNSPIFTECTKTCSYKPFDPIYAPWEGPPAKSVGDCAVVKHEYSLVAGKSAISIVGSEDKDRNRWLLAFSLLGNSLSNPNLLKDKQTSAYLNDPNSASAKSNFASVGSGTVWVNGYMRNGKYVRGYSRRKG